MTTDPSVVLDDDLPEGFDPDGDDLDDADETMGGPA